MIKRDQLDIWVINLDKRKDRLTSFDKEMKRCKLPYRRFAALQSADGLNIHLTPGAAGCAASHLRLLEQQASYCKTQNRLLCIFEDDAELCADFAERMQQIEDKFVFTDWDMFFLSSFWHLETNVPKEWYQSRHTGEPYYKSSKFYDARRDVFCPYTITTCSNIVKTHAAFTTTAYIVNPTSIDKLIALLKAELPIENPRRAVVPHGTRAVDHVLMMLMEEDRLNVYCFTPGMVKQRDGYSDIDCSSKSAASFFDKVCGPHIYQHHLAGFDFFKHFGLPNIEPTALQSSAHNDVLHYLRLHVPSDGSSIIIDIGAGAGRKCLSWTRKGYYCIAFEPVLVRVEALRKTAALRNLVVQNKMSIQPYALFDRNATGMIQSGREQICEFIRFDTWLTQVTQVTQAKPPSVVIKDTALVHINVKETDYNILQGMVTFLTSAKPEKLHLYFEHPLSSKSKDLLQRLSFLPSTANPHVFIKAEQPLTMTTSSLEEIPDVKESNSDCCVLRIDPLVMPSVIPAPPSRKSRPPTVAKHRTKARYQKIF